MPKYQCSIPTTGVVYIDVECDSADENEIFEAACEEFFKLKEVGRLAVHSWEFRKRVTKGNVTSAVQNDFGYEQVDE